MEELYQKSEDPSLCKVLMLFVDELLARAKIRMTDAEKLALLSHVSAMVYRSNHKEMIQAIDKTLFQEFSNESIEMASKVCGMIPDLHEDEKYLLSIHFEAAKITN